MSETVFVTGVAGFLGSHLADAFLEKDMHVVGNDTLQTGDRDNVPDGVQFHSTDCLHLSKMDDLLADIDLVYHTAALPYEGLSVFSPREITESVFGATTTVLTAAANNDVGRFVYCSSMARYGSNQVPFTEDMEPQPQDPYGISKVAAERMTRLLGEVFDFEWVIAVPHNIIGPRQRYDDPFRNVAAIFINRMLRGEQPIIYGDGEQRRCFSFIQDDVCALEKLGVRSNVTGEVVNIGPDKEFVTINELAETIADILDFDLDPTYVEDRPQEVKYANCSADKARQLIDYETAYDLREGLEEMIEWIRERGPKPFDYHFEPEITSEKMPVVWREQLL